MNTGQSYLTMRAASKELGISRQDLAVILHANNIPTVELVQRATGSICGVGPESMKRARKLVANYKLRRGA
jgi:molybdenum-dependent DNA-binding transcriptional regulator ModE